MSSLCLASQLSCSGDLLSRSPNVSAARGSWPSFRPNQINSSGSCPHGAPIPTREAKLTYRWVAKEAAYKALPFSGVTWKTLDLHHTAKGQPVLRHTSHASDTCDAVRLMLSISHDADVVVGVVVALSAESE